MAVHHHGRRPGAVRDNRPDPEVHEGRRQTGRQQAHAGSRLKPLTSGKALPDRPAFQPYWGKPAVRNERGDRGNVGIIRSPVRASILPDSWRVSITLEAAFCVEALEEALARHGRPEVFNTDQGSQFTSHDFTSVLLKAGITISMDGKGSWRDNVFVERLWRSIKSEEVYLRAYDTVSEARASIGRYLNFHNGRRPHSSLDRQTPDQAYFTRLPQSVAA